MERISEPELRPLSFNIAVYFSFQDKCMLSWVSFKQSSRNLMANWQLYQITEKEESQQGFNSHDKVIPLND